MLASWSSARRPINGAAITGSEEVTTGPLGKLLAEQSAINGHIAFPITGFRCCWVGQQGMLEPLHRGSDGENVAVCTLSVLAYRRK